MTEEVVVIPTKTYRLLRGLLKVMLDLHGGSATVDGSKLAAADEKTVESGFEGDPERWEDGTWHLQLVDAPPPEAPTLRVNEEPTPEPEEEPVVEQAERQAKQSLGPRWTQAAVVAAFLQWRAQHGEWPHAQEWRYAGDDRPVEQTVRNVFGGWAAATQAAEAELERGGDDVEGGRTPPQDRTDAAPSFEPDWRVAPGETLKEIMAERKLTVEAVAWRTGLGLPVAAVQAILDGVAHIDADVADQLEVALGEPTAAFWLNLETNYRKEQT